MTDEETFRAALIAILLMVLPFAIYYRIRSQMTREKLDRRQEGLFILATLRPVGIAILIAFIWYLVDPSAMAWSSIRLPSALRWTGIGLAVAAAVLWIWTFRCLGNNLTDTVVTRRGHTLVTRGPYRWVRHPFYDSVALWLLAIALVAANWFFLAAGAVLLWLLRMRTATEEANLVARFGDAYRTYMDKTGRFVPRLRSW